MTFPYKGREKKIPEVKCWYPQTVVYDPIKSGSIDGTDTEPHDFGIVRATNSCYKPSYKAKGNPSNTIFVGRLSLKTTEADLEKEFRRYGKIVGIRLVRDIVTGFSRRYAFIEYETFKMAQKAYAHCRSLILNDTEVFVDFECGRTLPGWKPRRLGGGFGGEKESGQLRFGGRGRKFRPPFGMIKLKRGNTYNEDSTNHKNRHQNSVNRGVNNTKQKPVVSTAPSTPSTTASCSNPIYVSTTSAPLVISLPLTPPLNPSIVLPLTPPSHSNIQLPLTPPSNPVIVLPLTPPQQPIVTLPLTPPPSSIEPLPLTPPPNSNPPPNFM